MTDHAQNSRNVLITGASSGIGAATARMFACNGFRVFGTSRSKHPDANGVEMLQLDVRIAESVTQCVGEVLDRAGHLNVLVNNAGVMHEAVAEETSMAEAAEVFEVNLFGTARVTNAVLPGMRTRRRGRIINIGSAAAWVGEPGEAFYAASKAALARYSEGLRHEVWPLGITVSLVEPGAFVTGVLQAAATPQHPIADYDEVRAAAHRTFQRSLGQGDDPAEAAALILRIARTPRPRLRYGAGREGRWLPYLRTLLPQRLTDTLLRRSFGLPAPAADNSRDRH